MVKRLLAIALGAVCSGALSPRRCRGSAADLSRRAGQRSGARRRRARPGSRRRKRAAGARRPAARRQPCRQCDRGRISTRRIHIDPTDEESASGFRSYAYTVSASQPLYRPQNSIALDQAKQQVGQSDFVLVVGAAGSDRPRHAGVLRRAAGAVQHRADREPEGGGQREPRAGQAQLRGRHGDDHRHQRRAGEVRPDRRAGDLGANDLDNKLAALRAIIGRAPSELKRFGGRFEPAAAVARTRSSPGSSRRSARTPQVRIAQSNFDIAALEVDRQRAGHYPTLDLVASFNQGYAGAAASTARLVGRLRFAARR